MSPDYDEVFRREHRAVVRTVFLIVGNAETANEVTQDAFAELYARWNRVRRYDRPGAWVRRVEIRRAVKARKRALRSEPVPDIDAAIVDNDPSPSLDTLRALDQLTPMQRAVVVLHYFQDLPVQEAAALVGCKPATASVHLHRARARLAELLGEPDDAEVETNAT